MKVTLTRVTENPIMAIEEAASNCYDSEPSPDGKIMKSCYKSGHHSVLEFADFTFHIEGISRACSHQLVRHRCASYAQRSQRYCSESGFQFVIPDSIKNNKEVLFCYEHFMEAIECEYEKLQKLGIPNEDARMVLPNACETVIEVKMNGRELIHFMNERLCSRAQWEIRKMAQLMKKEVENYNDQCKLYSEFLVPKCEKYGKNFAFCTECKSCNRHPKLNDVYNAYLKTKEGGAND